MDNKEYNELDIAQAWQKMAAEKFSHSIIKKEDIMTAIKKESNSSIAQLKKGLKHKLYWAVGITLSLIAWLLFVLGNKDMVILLSIAIGIYIIGIIPMYLKYKKVDDSIAESSDILTAMRSNANAIKSLLRLEKIWGLVTFVPAITIGILFGSISDGHSLVSCFQDSWILTKILLAIVILTPLMAWSSDQMNKKAYGQNLKKLEDNIVRMETLQ